MRKSILLGFILPIAAIIILFNLGTVFGITGLAAFVIYTVYSGLPGFYASLGRGRYIKGDFKGAEKWLERSYRTNRATVNIIVSYSYLLLKMGDIEKSEEVLKGTEGRKLTNREELGIQSNRALILWKRGELDKAVEMLTNMYEANKNTTLYGTLGYFLILKGDLQKALEFNKEAYEYNGRDQIIMDNLGQNYYLLGEYGKSKEIYDMLMDFFPTFPEPYYFYGCVLIELKEYEKALEVMKQALLYEFTALNTIKREDVEEKIKSLESMPKVKDVE